MILIAKAIKKKTDVRDACGKLTLEASRSSDIDLLTELYRMLINIDGRGQKRFDQWLREAQARKLKDAS